MPIWPGVAKFLIRLGVAQRLRSVRDIMGPGLPFLRCYNRRVLGSPNVELRLTKQLLHDAGTGVIDLASGAPPLLPEFAISLQLDPAMHSGYPTVNGLPDLRRALAAKLERENGLAIDPEEQLLVCNGVSQGIGLMLDTFVDRGDRVVIFDPSFFFYRLAAMHREASIVTVPTWLDAGRTMFHERRLARALRGARVLFLNTPANPTGGLLTNESLERIAWWCRKFDVLIFSDEVYEYFIHDGRHVSIASMPHASDRTITANSFSKSYGMAGLRIGYLAGPRYLIEPITVSFLAGAPFVSFAAQHMALHALLQSEKTRIQQRAVYATRARAIGEHLTRIGLHHDRPGGAFYFWIPVGNLGLTGQQFARELLDEQRVLVMAGESCGRSGRPFIRVSFAGPEAEIYDGLHRIAIFIARRCPQLLSLASERKAAETSSSGPESYRKSA